MSSGLESEGGKLMELDFRFFFGVSNLSRLGWIFADVIVVVRATDVT